MDWTLVIIWLTLVSIAWDVHALKKMRQAEMERHYQERQAQKE
jgi:hypothetical protein